MKLACTGNLEVEQSSSMTPTNTFPGPHIFRHQCDDLEYNADVVLTLQRFLMDTFTCFSCLLAALARLAVLADSAWAPRSQTQHESHLGSIFLVVKLA